MGTFGVGVEGVLDVEEGLDFEVVCVGLDEDGDGDEEEDESEAGESRSRPRIATTLPNNPEFSLDAGGTSSRMGYDSTSGDRYNVSLQTAASLFAFPSVALGSSL